MTTFENAIKDRFISKISITPSGYQFKFQPISNSAFHVLLKDCSLDISFGSKAIFKESLVQGMEAVMRTADTEFEMYFYTCYKYPVEESIEICRWAETKNAVLDGVGGISTEDMISRLIDNLVEVASKNTSTTCTIRTRPVEVLDPEIRQVVFVPLR
jgi:hypothetical protein